MTSSPSRFIWSAALLFSGALTGGAALAQPSPSMVLARVVSATPQMQQVPVQACDPAAAAPTGGGAAVGALAGGAIGSQIGNGNGHIAGAILGAIGGALAGNAIEAQNRAVTGAGCGVQYQNQITGYDVRYEWGGRQYRTQMASDPGQWINVAQPVGDGSYAEPAYANNAPQQQAPGYYPAPAPAAPPPTVGTQVAPPYGAYPAYPQPAYPQPVYTPQPMPVYGPPVYPAAVYPAPVMVQPAPVYAVPPVGVSIGVGGGWRRSGWGVGVGF